MKPLPFKRHRFPPVVILHAFGLYARFTRSFRDVEERLAKHGVDASNETVRRWFLNSAVWPRAISARAVHGVAQHRMVTPLYPIFPGAYAAGRRAKSMPIDKRGNPSRCSPNTG
jgi:hypothetical protein